MNILYLDDDPEDREFFQEAVQAVDPAFNCYTANDGKAGLDVLDQLVIVPDYIFVDVNMPVMTGREFLIQVKQMPGLRSIPLIMYSTTSRPDEIQEYLNRGAFKVLNKPHSFEDLCALLSSILKEAPEAAS